LTRAIKKLIALFLRDAAALTRALDGGSVDAWQQQMSAALARYHTSALLVGQGNETLTPQGRRYLGKAVQAQLKYLNNFAVEIQSAESFKPGWLARAALYAQGIGASYWKGKTKFLPLPAMPRDGTSQCLSNCTCSWEIIELDGDGNYDCHWKLGATERHCQTCPTRARDWAPLKIRNGELQ
jgi:hypothetical protein